ncbi:MAG: pseudoazurin [Geminicoccaceae bacterium]
MVLAVALAGFSFSTPARAVDHVVKLVTEGEHGRFLFEPSLLLVDPGDTVTFIPESRMHGVKSVAGMLPEGAMPWRGRMGEEVSVRLTQPGVYGVKCPAGYEIGMVALIMVGRDPPNWDAARAVRHPPAANAAFDALFAAAACDLATASTVGCATN